MNLVQFLILVVVFLALFVLLAKNKKKLDKANKNIFKIAIFILGFILAIIAINSGIFSQKLPEELGGGARYTPKMEEKVSKMNAPKLEVKTKIEYKKEGEKSLNNALK